MHQVEITRIGDSLGIVLPNEIVERLGIKYGQILSLSQTPNGLEFSIFDPEFERQMRAAEKIMDRYRDTLRTLAK